MNTSSIDTAVVPKLSADGFHRLFAGAPVAMLIEGHDGIIKDINEASCELMATTRAHIVGQHASAILPPKQAGETTGSKRAGLLTRLDGSSVSVTVLTTPIALGLDEAYLVTMWPAEQSLSGTTVSQSTSPAAEKKNGEIDLQSACSRIAHILNNSLTTIKGFASLAKDQLQDGEVQPEHLEEIYQAANRGGEFAHALLRFGQPRERNADALDINASLQDSESNFRSIVGENAGLSVILGSRIPAIEADREAFIELVGHLLENSKRATSGMGEIQITTTSDELDGELYAVLTIADDGAGMTKDVLDRALQPFYSDPTNRTANGLGLSICYGLMRDFGGRMELESSAGSGTSVRLLFPASEAASIPLEALSPSSEAISPSFAEEPRIEAKDLSSTSKDSPILAEAPMIDSPSKTEAPSTATTKPAKKRPGAPGGKETILVVEDEDMVRDLVKRSLGYLGYQVIDACNGEEGLEVARQRGEEIDMIFTDIVMPRMSGPEMVARMTEAEIGYPVLYTTGFTDNKRLLDNGEIREGVNLLPKPYTTKVLANRIREVLDS